MNYLAHAYLADTSERFLIGSFIGDFIKGPVEGRFDGEMRRGIIFHRKIDAFADSHALNISSRALFSRKYRRYAGIIMDICNDHYLAAHWSSYSSVAFEDYIARLYRLLEREKNLLPERFQAVLPRLINQNWLQCYGSLRGVELTLERISRRISRKNELAGAMEDIRKHYFQFEKNFSEFFPEIVEFAKAYVVSDAESSHRGYSVPNPPSTRIIDET